MNRSTRLARTLLTCLLAVLMLLAIAPLALAEEADQAPEPDTNNFTGTYEIGGSTGTGKKFAAVIVIWDRGTQATVRGVVPKIGKALSWSFPVEQVSDTEYLVSGSVWIPVLGSGSGAATITKKGDGYEIGGSGTGTFFEQDRFGHLWRCPSLRSDRHAGLDGTDQRRGRAGARRDRR